MEQEAAGGYLAGAMCSSEDASRQAKLYAELWCPQCGYSLRGLTRPVCPECAQDLTFIESPHAAIPWERDRRSRFVAFWKTVWAVLARGDTFWLAAWQPMDARAARSFKWMAWAHGAAAIVLSFAAMVWMNPVALDVIDDAIGTELGVYLAVCAVIVLLVATHCLGLLMNYAWLPARLADNQRLLAAYATAPLALMLPTVLMLVALASVIPGVADIFEIPALTYRLVVIGTLGFTLWCAMLASGMGRRIRQQGVLAWVFTPDVGQLLWVGIVLGVAFGLLVVGLVGALIWYTL